MININMKLCFVSLFSICLIVNCAWLSADDTPEIMTAGALSAFPNPAPDARISYGDGPLQFADLRRPKGPGPHPVMILIHGGCWLAEYDITHIGKLADAFARNGIATWTLEYRRVGDAGGGWPGTFQDVMRGSDHLLSLAEQYSLDMNRVIVAGHSAGGHLALWLAGREQFKDTDFFSSASAVQLKGVLGLAPAPDLAQLHQQGVCGNVIDKLMGGSPAEYPERYAIASAIEMVPIALPQLLVIGKYDEAWAPVGQRYFDAALAVDDTVRLVEAPESGHFEMIDPDSSTWPLVLSAANELLGVSEVSAEEE